MTPDVKVLTSNLAGCLGGQQALGISLTFNADMTYQESWYVVRAGRSYDFQWLAPKGAEQTDTFREMFRTWQWTPNVPAATPLPSGAASPSASPGASGASPSASPTTSGSAQPSVSPGASGTGSAFVLAGMAVNVDPAATSANPKDFLTTLPAGATTIYAVFVLRTGLTGGVSGVLISADKVLANLSLQYGASNTWGNFKVAAPGGITPGTFTMALTYAPTGETINLPFTVK